MRMVSVRSSRLLVAGDQDTLTPQAGTHADEAAADTPGVNVRLSEGVLSLHALARAPANSEQAPPGQQGVPLDMTGRLRAREARARPEHAPFLQAGTCPARGRETRPIGPVDDRCPFGGA